MSIPRRFALSTLVEAASGFARNDGPALASHVALSLVIALFPFLICVAALAALLGAGRISSHILHLLFDFWPDSVAGPLWREATKILSARGSVMTLSVVVTVLVATNGVDSLRVALDRAYGVQRLRPWWRARLIAVAFVLLGAATLVASSLLVVIWPTMWRTAVSYISDLKGWRITYDAVRYGLAAVILVAGLLATHLWLPDSRPRFRDVVPGVAITLLLWLVGAALFGEFLARFTHIKSTYAGLAGIVTALIFLQLSAAIFIFGAECNAALRRRREIGQGAEETPAELQCTESYATSRKRALSSALRKQCVSDDICR